MDVFRPERWDDPTLRPGWGYIPSVNSLLFQPNDASYRILTIDGPASFNGGARICLGQQFALTEASYTLVRLMQEFASIQNRDGEEDWKEQIALVTKSRNGTKVALMKAETEG